MLQLNMRRQPRDELIDIHMDWQPERLKALKNLRNKGIPWPENWHWDWGAKVGCKGGVQRWIRHDSQALGQRSCHNPNLSTGVTCTTSLGIDPAQLEKFCYFEMTEDQARVYDRRRWSRSRESNEFRQSDRVTGRKNSNHRFRAKWKRASSDG